MARKIKVSSSVLNVRTHPHSPERYAQLVSDLFKQKIAVKLHGDRFGMLSLVHKEANDRGFVSGIITTFVKVEFDGRWFDASEMQDATEAQVAKVQIPENLHPNAASFYFEFDTEKHRLYVQSYSEGKSLSARQAQTLFESLAAAPRIQAEYGKVHVTIVQSRAGLEALFALPVIKEVKITIYKPNPDIFADDFENQIEAHLAQTNSQRISLSYQADPGQSVNPTDEMRAVSEVALENGEVEVRGRDEKGAVTKSTEQMPAELHDKFDPDEMSEQNAFRRLIPRWIGLGG
ncbi:DUF4747 family protein [Erythrobacter litoralis]|nr:DUF4747 family protein [Erythrobacter litoralis]